MRIALTGNPNSGKTTMYNALTGSNEKVGNWAGVTVEKKEHAIKKSYCADVVEDLIAVDLPGAYSMSPFTSEESITSSYVKNENPDVIINIVDATNLSRSLFFTTQLLELGIPVVVALNKADLNKKKQNRIDVAALSQKLNCPVVDTVSTSSEGLKDVVAAAIARVGTRQVAPYVQGDIDLTDKKVVEAADRKRFAFVNGIVKAVETRKVFTNKKNAQDKIDAVLTNKWAGIPIFAVVMFLVFFISQATLGAWIAEGYEFENGFAIPGLVTLLEGVQGWVAGLVSGTPDIVQALLVDGIIGGVIAVVGFLPLVMVMYFLIALLEDCGYMARATVVLDPIFKKVGLSGKSVISFVVGTGCSVPGVMACRTIRNERERRATAMLAPFMPCGAKLPVIALFAGVFFDESPWVGPLMYFAGIVIIFIGALLVKKITGFKAKKSYFIIELPEYKAPSLWRACKSMCSRGWAFIVKAGTIILLCNTVVQIMQSFAWNFQPAESADTSILASIAGPIAYLLVPVVGVLSWQLAAAAVTGFIAKENVVGTLAVCYSVASFTSPEQLTGTIQGETASLTAIAGLAYLMFNLFSPPCFAAIGAMNSEMKSAKWLWGGIGLQLGVGYTIAYLVYTVGTLITDPSALAVGPAICGLIAVAVFVAVLVVLCLRSDKKLKENYALNASK
ncbi:MAG: ferrous iron transporter B [Clostridia bacterium]|nr:ferrous iron transporter B [Clostridia bacterium]MBQ2272393.1 ferrous iron transporter B [Clostridia bacterium]